MENKTVSVDQVMIRVVEDGDTKTLLKLVNFGKTSNISDMNGDPLLFIPIVNGNMEMLDTLLTYGRKSRDMFNSYKLSLRKQTFSEKIFIAIHSFFDYFLGACDLELSNFEERTALMLAVEMDDIRMVRHLIKAGKITKRVIYKYIRDYGMINY